MKHLFNASQIKNADRYTIEEKGVFPQVLMERAADACVRCMEEEGLNLSRVCVVCGSGNNGGDGFAIARILTEKGHLVETVFVGESSRCTEETARQKELLFAAGGKVSAAFKAEDAYSVVVDALFGVGLSRDVEGAYAAVIQQMNVSGARKVAVDIPSGISADTGAVMGTAFVAQMTVTFQEMKSGLLLYPGNTYAGKIITADIGIDTTKEKEEGSAAYTYEKEEYKELLPVRMPDSHKGTYGKVLIIAGSKGMAGAAYLSGKAAYMTGAGLVQIYTVEENRVILQELLPEAIVKTYELFDEKEVLKLLIWADVVSVGSGIGTSEKAKRILRTVIENVEVPCIIDADGLNLLGEHKKYLTKLNGESFIFTPHMKEMARLTGVEIETLKQNRMEVLKKFVDAYSVTCVLKDARTVVMSPKEPPCINLSGCAAMAKAGQGDVLSGVITGLVAQGLSCTNGAILGVYLHGRAGELAAQEKGGYSVLAGDSAVYLSRAIKELEEM